MSKGGPMGHGRRPSEKAKNFKGTMKKLLVYLKPFLPKIIFAMIFAIASTIFSIVGPKILGNSTGLRPLWIIFAITLGGWAAGPLGMFLGVPAIAVIAFLLDNVINKKLTEKNIIILSPEPLKIEKKNNT